MKNKVSFGHLCALVTIIIWGTTFISTKILLSSFQPVEILFLRFLTGWLTLLVVYPGKLRDTNIHQELMFAAAGLSGICLYYLLENIALTYTSASNVGVIISTAPFFTALLSKLIFKQEHLETGFYIGFLLSMTGIALISFNGAGLKLNPAGDLLALAAAMIWACYSVVMKIISQYGYPTIPVTRRIFLYGLIFMMPAVLLSDFSLDPGQLLTAGNLLNLLYLGIGASALCFVSWNYAVMILGAIRTSIYIYLVPVITVVTSVFILHEPVTFLSVLGIALTLSGLLLSESRSFQKERIKENG